MLLETRGFHSRLAPSIYPESTIHVNQFKVYSIFLFSKNIPIFVAIKYVVYSLSFFEQNV